MIYDTWKRKQCSRARVPVWRPVFLFEFHLPPPPFPPPPAPFRFEPVCRGSLAQGAPQKPPLNAPHMDHLGAKLRPVASSFATIDQRTATLEGTFCTTLGISRLPTSVLGLPAVLFDGEVSPRELRKTTPWKPQIDPMQPCQRHICAGIRSSNCTFTTTCLRSMCVVLTVAHIQ